MNVQTSIRSWITTDNHESVVETSRLIVYVRLHIGSVEVGCGFSDCPLAEASPYMANNETLFASAVFKSIVAKATEKADAQFSILREGMAQ